MLFTPNKQIFLVAVVLIIVRTVEPDRAATVANGKECADIGKTILDAGGSACDAVISMLLCEGVASAQSTGLGGGFIATIFYGDSKEAEVLIARDVAPIEATQDMFVNRTETGALTSSVPGELAGYFELWKKCGLKSWPELFDPVINLCYEGHVVTPYFAGILEDNEGEIRDSETLSEIYINPKTNKTYQVGDKIKRPKLAETLKIIAKEGVTTMYGNRNGTIANKYVQDNRAAGGILTIEDFVKYKPRWEKPISFVTTDNKTVYIMPLPGSGPLVAYSVNMLDDGYLGEEESVLGLHRMTEAFKFSFARRSELGDDYFEPSVDPVVKNLTSKKYAVETRRRIDDSRTFDANYYEAKYSSQNDYGTAHVNVIDSRGNAIAATGTINTYFGCNIRSPQTGIIMNDGMKDFSTPNQTNNYNLPPSKVNFIKPGKMAQSSMSPTIMVNEYGEVVLAIGAAGGPEIITSVISVLSRVLFYKETIVIAANASRIHNQWIPERTKFQSDLNQSEVEGLREKGHNMVLVSGSLGTLTAIQVNGSEMIPVYDKFRGGSTAIIS